MAQNKEEIIIKIDVDYAKAVKDIATYQQKIDDLKKSQQDLKKQLADNAISQEDYGKAMAANKLQIDYNKKAINELSKEVQNNIKIDQAHVGSLEQLKAILSNANLEFGKMSEAQRATSDRGRELSKTITETTAKLKAEEEALGDHRRSVGITKKQRFRYVLN